MNNKTKRLTESAMLIALAVVLEFAGRMVIPPMPFGGQLTLVSMLPIATSWLDRKPTFARKQLTTTTVPAFLSYRLVISAG